ncbi:copper amine oxidase N-terminal domain-containing protein [Paenibacillus endoradicis]|uniref:copper amine oxidase N-terminal domain-containing protein n=1 Tax=Paenibacillus endoradicis TaxID=2972487 RepID=UPI0021594B88|nr:copper amine oxidase N-terminal domain-containing protein [Paenibacillus endoradicis]MCR8656717.1 copper amine oxidase N-terminal domain-containing protein [Paenibacillus endoradicis]
MKKTIQLFMVIILSIALLVPTTAAHSGRTDANGGHNCSEKSKSKGLCTGYHYHSGSSSTSSSSSSSNSSTKKSNSSSSKSKTTTVKKAEYEKSSVTLYVNDVLVKLDNDILVKENSNYFPVRDVVKAIGATLEIDKTADVIKITKNKKSATLSLSSKNVISKNNTTYAPIRDIVGDLGATITFDKDNNRIYINIK